MEQYHQITITEYLQWKQEIKDRLNGTVDNFVVIGYRLKQIRDNEAYKTDGYDTMGAFVQAEYGLNEATASKFIKINDVYSEGGNSLYLKEQYKGFGYNKLYEMIALPVEDKQLITADMSVKDIREVKSFNREAKAAGDTSEIDTRIPEDEKKLYLKLLEEKAQVKKWILAGESNEKIDDILEELAPSGNRMIRQGTLMCFLKSKQEGIALKRFGAGTEQISYTEWFERAREILKNEEKEAAVALESTEDAQTAEEPGQETKQTETESFDVEKEKSGQAEKEDFVVDAQKKLKTTEGVSEKPKNVSKQPESVSKPTANVQEPSEDTKEKRKSVIDISKVKDAEELKNALQKENEEESPSSEPDIMTRWDYLKTLSAIDAADYIQSYLDPEAIEDIRMLKNWLLTWVDGNGKI